jgi:hypothetical protein
VIRIGGAVIGIYMGFGGFPIRAEADIGFAGELADGAGGAEVGGAAHFPPALAAMVVGVIDDEAGLFHEWADPAHAVVAIVRVLLEAVLDEETFGGAGVHVYAEDILLRGGGPVATFFGQGVAPVFLHAFEALANDEGGGVALGVFINGLMPVVAH